MLQEVWYNKKTGNNRVTHEEYAKVMWTCNWGTKRCTKILVYNNKEQISVFYISESYYDRPSSCRKIIQLYLSVVVLI